MNNKNYLIQTIRNLRPHYQFDRLPESYFKQLPSLSEDPSDLLSEFLGFFLITQWKNLVKLQYYKQKLKESYDFKENLPNNYFDLSPPKKSLLSIYQLLES